MGNVSEVPVPRSTQGIAGSPEATYALVVRSELPQSYRIAALILGSELDAEDVVQDAMLKAWERITQLRDPERAGAWFGRILVNSCRDQLRRRRASPVGWIPSPAVIATEESVVARDTLDRALSLLPYDHRIAVILRFYADLSIADIADRTNAPVGTVKTRLYHALRALRAQLDSEKRTSEAWQ